MAGAALIGLGAPGVAAGQPVAWISAIASRQADVSYAIPDHDGAQIDREQQIILVRWQNAVYAFALSCPHQKTALRWLEADARFQCPKHKSKYRPDGAFISGRATRGMDRFAIRRAGNAVIVNTAALNKQTVDAAAWDAAVVKLS